MARKRDAQEPLLIAAARSLGKAAGTLVNMTQLLTIERSPSAFAPESIQPETPGKKKNSSSTRRNLPTKRLRATPRNKGAKSRKASARDTSTTKRGPSRKR